MLTELDTVAMIGALTCVLFEEVRSGTAYGGYIQRYLHFVCSAEYLDMEIVWYVWNMIDVCFGWHTDCRRIAD
jgi:hypothetical protein